MSDSLISHTPALRGMLLMSLHPVRTAGIAVLALLVSLSACGRGDANEVPSAEPITVNVGPEGVDIAERTVLSIGPILSGSLVAERTAQIRAEVAGAVLTVNVDPGAVVTTGTSLAKIDDRAIQDAYLGARSGYTAAQTAADLAARELGRAERLHAAGALADRDLENARRADLSARSMLDDARARLSQAEKARDAAQVLAPYDGVVSERLVNPGDIVNPGAPLFAIVDPSTMRLEAAVPASELAMVRIGAPVRFGITGYPGRTFEGRISSINPQADPQTRQVRLFVRIPNEGQRLVAGLFAQGRIASETREALTVPSQALDERGLQPQVIRLKNGVTERVVVQVGVRDAASARIEIIDGLMAGDTVLVGAALGVTVGSRVKVSAPSDTMPQR
jgi:membrane fusion protein (multidrug efflux system)